MKSKLYSIFIGDVSLKSIGLEFTFENHSSGDDFPSSMLKVNSGQGSLSSLSLQLMGRGGNGSLLLGTILG